MGRKDRGGCGGLGSAQVGAREHGTLRRWVRAHDHELPASDRVDVGSIILDDVALVNPDNLHIGGAIVD